MPLNFLSEGKGMVAKISFGVPQFFKVAENISEKEKEKIEDYRTKILVCAVGAIAFFAVSYALFVPFMADLCFMTSASFVTYASYLGVRYRNYLTQVGKEPAKVTEPKEKDKLIAQENISDQGSLIDATHEYQKENSA